MLLRRLGTQYALASPFGRGDTAKDRDGEGEDADREVPPKNKKPRARHSSKRARERGSAAGVSAKVLKQTLNLCCAGLWLLRTVHDAVRKNLHLPVHQSLKRWKSPPVHCLFNRRSGFASPPKKRVCFLGALPRKLPFWESWRSRRKTPAFRIRRVILRDHLPGKSVQEITEPRS